MEFLKSPNAALILALVYFLFPLDLIPDIFGPFGRIDDIAVFGLAVWRMLKSRQQQRPSQHTSNTADSNATGSSSKDTPNPYRVFNLSPGASRQAIETRYKELAKNYHPDRVAHLGEELQKVAHEKMIEIQRAYDTLTEKGSQ